MTDTRQGESYATLSPSKGEAVNKVTGSSSELPFVSCVDVHSSKEWLATGGAFHSTMVWHLPSLSVSAMLPTSGIPNSCLFTADDQVGDCRFIVNDSSRSYCFN